jgi:diaminopimelate epimerase
MAIVLEKYHGLGNDYLIVDPNKNNLKMVKESVQLLCNRHFGIGSDGILYGPIFENNKIKVKIYNPDGSEAEKSGNGIRIFSRYLKDAGYIKNQALILDTLGGSVEVEYIDNKAHMLMVVMGKVAFMSDVIPVAGPKREVVNEIINLNGVNYKMTCVSIGNPHCVIVMDEISSNLAKELGPLVENNELFPKRINMQLMKVIDRQNIQIEIYERGAGYTLASGSSSCAAAAVAYKLDLIDSSVIVHMPGGNLKIDIKPDGMIFMTGPVNGVGTITLSEQFEDELKAIEHNKVNQKTYK